VVDVLDVIQAGRRAQVNAGTAAVENSGNTRAPAGDCAEVASGLVVALQPVPVPDRRLAPAPGTLLLAHGRRAPHRLRGDADE
jgi:hypothetical protein